MTRSSGRMSNTCVNGICIGPWSGTCDGVQCLNQTSCSRACGSPCVTNNDCSGGSTCSGPPNCACVPPPPPPPPSGPCAGQPDGTPCNQLNCNVCLATPCVGAARQNQYYPEYGGRCSSGSCGSVTPFCDRTAPVCNFGGTYCPSAFSACPGQECGVGFQSCPGGGTCSGPPNCACVPPPPPPPPCLPNCSASCGGLGGGWGVCGGGGSCSGLTQTIGDGCGGTCCCCCFAGGSCT